MHISRWFPRLAVMLLGLALLSGCDGGPTVPVTGTVTLDGQPLQDAIVTFAPQKGGRPSADVTDSSGYYELVYSRDSTGAVPGEHLVTISTFIEAEPDQGETGSPEKVPAKYNVNSELVETVERGGSTIDFDLDSEGEIIEAKGGYGGGGGGQGGYGGGGGRGGYGGGGRGGYGGGY